MIRSWSSEPLFDLDNLSTKYTVSKIELLAKHIAVFREECAKVSSMAVQLEVLLEDLLLIIKPKKTEVI